MAHHWKLFGHLLAFCSHFIKKNTGLMNSVLAESDAVVEF